jgi:hypothetical protein
MKLFLTATSERGKPVTKSGNEYIEILLSDEKRKSIVKLVARYKSSENITIEYMGEQTPLYNYKIK